MALRSPRPDGRGAARTAAARSAALPHNKPGADSTDLGRPLTAEINRQFGAVDATKPPAAAVVLISDGQHNDGPSPLAAAALLGQREIPLFTIGVGAVEAPPDLAIVGVDAPQTVFYDDRLRGNVAIDDHMPANQTFRLRVECDGKTV